MMHQRRYLYTAIRNILNSMRPILATTIGRLHLTMFQTARFLTIQELPPPPRKLIAYPLQVTPISFWFLSLHQDSARANTPFFIKPKTLLTHYTRCLLKRFHCLASLENGCLDSST